MTITFNSDVWSSPVSKRISSLKCRKCTNPIYCILKFTLMMKKGGDKDWILDHLVVKALVRANSYKKRDLNQNPIRLVWIKLKMVSKIIQAVFIREPSWLDLSKIWFGLINPNAHTYVNIMHVAAPIIKTANIHITTLLFSTGNPMTRTNITQRDKKKDKELEERNFTNASGQT